MSELRELSLNELKHSKFEIFYKTINNEFKSVQYEDFILECAATIEMDFFRKIQEEKYSYGKPSHTIIDKFKQTYGSKPILFEKSGTVDGFFIELLFEKSNFISYFSPVKKMYNKYRDDFLNKYV